MGLSNQTNGASVPSSIATTPAALTTGLAALFEEMRDHKEDSRRRREADKAKKVEMRMRFEAMVAVARASGQDVPVRPKELETSAAESASESDADGPRRVNPVMAPQRAFHATANGTKFFGDTPPQTSSGGEENGTLSSGSVRSDPLSNHPKPGSIAKATFVPGCDTPAGPSSIPIGRGVHALPVRGGRPKMTQDDFDVGRPVPASIIAARKQLLDQHNWTAQFVPSHCVEEEFCEATGAAIVSSPQTIPEPASASSARKKKKNRNKNKKKLFKGVATQSHSCPSLVDRSLSAIKSAVASMCMDVEERKEAEAQRDAEVIRAAQQERTTAERKASSESIDSSTSASVKSDDDRQIDDLETVTDDDDDDEEGNAGQQVLGVAEGGVNPVPGGPGVEDEPLQHASHIKSDKNRNSTKDAIKDVALAVGGGVLLGAAAALSAHFIVATGMALTGLLIVGAVGFGVGYLLSFCGRKGVRWWQKRTPIEA